MIENIDSLLEIIKIIAVVGLSSKPDRASHVVSEYMQKQGYRIIPVYPKEEKILGEKVYRSLSEIKERVDAVVIFRRSEEVLAIVKEAIKLKPAVIWMQEGIINEEAAQLARKSNIDVVMDKCILKEHARKEGKR